MGAERHRQETAAREAEVWRLRVQGWTQSRIAARLKCSQSAVSQMLAKLEKKFHEEFFSQAAEFKARQTAQLELMYEEAMEQWRRSQQDAERTQVVTGRAKATNDGALIDLPDLETRMVEGRTGDAALLGQALAALAAIRKIWGLDAPAKQEISGPAGGPVAIREVVVELPRGES